MPESVNLQRSFSSLNEHLAKQFDSAGVRRSFTVPFVDGQPMADHITSVGQAATTAGGLGGNLITSAHRASGKGYGSGDGSGSGWGDGSGYGSGGGSGSGWVSGYGDDDRRGYP